LFCPGLYFVVLLYCPYSDHMKSSVISCFLLNGVFVVIAVRV
jgi:hypothetical protein